MLNKWERKRNRRCEDGNTVVSSIFPLQRVFAFTETSDQPEYSKRQTGATLSHYTGAGAGGGVR
jgi:hypothetical protein